jgi:sugar lactone lactonase YvrE/PKD repeat protein
MRRTVAISRRTSLPPGSSASRVTPWSALLVAALVLATGAGLVAAEPMYHVSPISTIAGVAGVYSYAGDDGPANQAALNLPFSVAVAADGTYYIADTFNSVVRKVDPAGVITTFAGTGDPGFSGDTGLATAAQLDSPERVFLAPGGASLYIADTGNCAIRKVDLATNIITTVAGTGDCGFSGDNGPATSALLDGPSGIVVLADGTMYICDMWNDRVRKVSPTGTITTFAGTGTTGYSGDGGPATSAKLSAPAGVAVDATGRVYIADSDNAIIRRVALGGTITTVAGVPQQEGYGGDHGPATSALLQWPYDVETDAYGNFFLVDSGNQCIRKVDSGGTITTVVGVPEQYGYFGDGGPAYLALLSDPQGMTIAPDEKMYIADSGNSVVRLVTPATGNELPTCDITYDPPSAAWGETITFDSHAQDTDGTVAGVTWNFGDGQSGSGETTTHAYALPGLYTVTATVTDDQGGIGVCDTDVSATSWQLVSECLDFTADDLGWHLISLPLPPDNGDPYVTFDTASGGYDPTGRLYRYDPITRGYIGLLPGDPAGFGTMDEHHGYWLSVEEPFTLCYTGRRYPPQNKTHSLDIGDWPSGWVLLGSGVEGSVPLPTKAQVSYNWETPIPFWNDDPGVEDAVQLTWIGLPLYGWALNPTGYFCVSPAAGSGCDTSSLEPWHGYWMDVEMSDLTLIINP